MKCFCNRMQIKFLIQMLFYIYDCHHNDTWVTSHMQHLLTCNSIANAVLLVLSILAMIMVYQYYTQKERFASYIDISLLFLYIIHLLQKYTDAILIIRHCNIIRNLFDLFLSIFHCNRYASNFKHCSIIKIITEHHNLIFANP